MKQVEIYTDGACSGNPGPGGWGAVLKYGEVSKELSGYEENTTNNRMEMTACIKALEILKEPCKVTLTTDSQYVVNTITLNWKKKKNTDLWEELYKLLEIHNVTFVWVRGHNGHPENERCDRLAVAARGLITGSAGGAGGAGGE